MGRSQGENVLFEIAVCSTTFTNQLFSLIDEENWSTFSASSLRISGHVIQFDSVKINPPPWPESLMFVISQNPSHVFFAERMELMLLLDHPRPCSKISLPSSLGRQLNFKPMFCIKFLAPIFLGATLVRLEVFFNKEKGTHLKCKKKLAQILQLTLGVIITPMISIMPG